MNYEDDKQKNKRLSQLFSITDKNAVQPDREFLDKLQEKTTTEFITSSANKSKQSITTFPLWRIIMKNQITKLAAAAVIIAAVLLTFFYTGTKEAYALDQTIEAMRKVTTVHCFINLFTGQRMEVWSKVNPETGENEYFNMSMPGLTIISTPDETYQYNEAQNVVTHLKGSGHVVSDINFGRFIEDMAKIAESINGKIEFKQIINKEKPAILLTIETDNAVLESIVDPYTKLPISMNFKPKGEPQPGQLGQSIEDFTFNAPLPEGIFNFKIPEGAKVIEQ
jgi:outer membrane lipoprotein-sorting protein